jgi:hypothetical protein
MKIKGSPEVYILGAVVVVAVVGVLSLLMTGSSNNLTGQALGDPTCKDTDGGSAYTTQGTITGGTWKTTGAAYTSETDSCLTKGSQLGKLKEYFCSDATHAFYVVKSCATVVGAGYVCISGACVLDSDSDGVPDATDVCPGYDDADDADGDGTPDGCDTTTYSDLTHDEDSTSFTVTGTGYITAEGDIADLDVTMTSLCGIRNDGTGTAATPSGGRTYSKCSFKDSSSSILVAPTFSISTFSLAPGDIYTWGSTNTLTTASFQDFFEELYAGATDIDVVYSIDSYAKTSYRITESDETNNAGTVTISVDPSAITWVEVDCASNSDCSATTYCDSSSHTCVTAECTSDSDCPSGCACSTRDYACYETKTSETKTEEETEISDSSTSITSIAC